jgi:hypothetical protein
MEVSKRTPLILIRLDDTNPVYLSLLRRVSAEASGVAVETSFNDWLQCNRRVMNLVRLFFLSYMIFAQAFKGKCVLC